MFGTHVIPKAFHDALGVIRFTIVGKRAIYQVAIGFKVIGGAYGTDHAIAVARSKINLNFVANNSGCSDRAYKILAAGGFLLSEDWPGRALDFVDGQDLVIFCGLNDLNRKIHFYLEHENKRMVIAGQGMKSVQRFTRVEFARKIIALAESVEEPKRRLY
jgi:spore maturation protein CgeB